MNFKRIFLLIFVLLEFSFLQAQQKTQYYNEPYRPQFHFTPQTNWMNDPNGLVYLDGEYNMFYQYYPYANVWGPMHWGHTKSTDLIHWKHLPIALYPDSLGNIFSGSAVIDKNNTAGFGKNAMVAIFTYHNDSLWIKGYRNTESQGIAYSLDKGLTWTKFKGNPVIKNSSERDFRDPKVFWNDDINQWNMVLAVGDRIKIFSSPNLIDWKYKSDFKPENDLPNLGVWECPDLFKIKYGNDDKWVMIINHGDNAPNGGSGTRYFVGSFDGETFKNEQPSIWLDYGTDFYAGVTFSNVPENKRILIAWMSNWQYAKQVPTEVWRSAMTLPRELTLDKENGKYFLRQKIVNQFSSIIHPEIEMDSVDLPYVNKDIILSQTEILFNNSSQNITIEFSNTLGENIRIALEDNQLKINRNHSGKIDFSDKFSDKVQTMPLDDKIYSFQFILDKSSVEILLNDGKYSMTNLFFPNKEYSNLKISSGLPSKIKNLKIYKVDRVWN